MKLHHIVYSADTECGTLKRNKDDESKWDLVLDDQVVIGKASKEDLKDLAEAINAIVESDEKED